MEIHELPLDIKRLIVCELNLSNLANFKRASKYWNQFIQYHEIISAREIRRRKLLWRLCQYNPLKQLLDVGINVLRHIRCGCLLVTPELIKAQHMRLGPEITENPLITMNDLRDLLTPMQFATTHYHVWRDSYVTIAELSRTGLKINWEMSAMIVTVKDYLAQHCISLTNLAMFGNITETDIINHPEIPWEYKYLINNNQLSVEFLAKHFNVSLGLTRREIVYSVAKYRESAAAQEYTSADELDQFLTDTHVARIYNKYAKITDILQFPTAQWDWAIISARDDIPMSTMLANAHLPWKWHLHKSVVKLPENADHTHPWLQFELKFEHNTLTYDDIMRNSDIPWVMARVVGCRNISIDTLIAAPLAPGVMSAITRREDLSFDIICKHPHVKWDLHEICHKLNRYAAELLKL